MKTPRKLITTDEKISFVHSLHQKFHRQGELLLPDSEIYPEIHDENSIELTAKKIFVWLGTKPSGIEFEISESVSGFTITDGHKKITINSGFQDNTYIVAAILAKSCVDYLLYKKGVAKDPELTELAIIELGLGLLIMNAFDSGSNFRSIINRFTPLSSAYVPKEILDFYSIDEFKRKFGNYTVDHELNLMVIYEHTLPWARRTLPEHDYSTVKSGDEPYVSEAKDRQKQIRSKALLMTIIVLLLLPIMFLLYTNQPKKLSDDLQSQKDTIETLELAYSKCTDGLKQKQAELGDDDFFIIRQLDTYLSRCNSLKNKHDYFVRQYNQNLEKEKLL